RTDQGARHPPYRGGGRSVMTHLSYGALDSLCESKLGTCDVACPLCGPNRRDPANRKRRVLRIWQGKPGFASYHCARCGTRGGAREVAIHRTFLARDGGGKAPIDPAK